MTKVTQEACKKALQIFSRADSSHRQFFTNSGNDPKALTERVMAQRFASQMHRGSRQSKQDVLLSSQRSRSFFEYNKFTRLPARGSEEDPAFKVGNQALKEHD